MSEDTQAVGGGDTPKDDPCARLAADLCAVLRSLAPPDDACRHFRTARLEVLKGLRAVIDSRIEHLSAEPPKGTSVSID